MNYTEQTFCEMVRAEGLMKCDYWRTYMPVYYFNSTEDYYNCINLSSKFNEMFNLIKNKNGLYKVQFTEDEEVTFACNKGIECETRKTSTERTIILVAFNLRTQVREGQVYAYEEVKEFGKTNWYYYSVSRRINSIEEL